MDNAAAALNTLPSEILSMIFEYLTLEEVLYVRNFINRPHCDDASNALFRNFVAEPFSQNDWETLDYHRLVFQTVSDQIEELTLTYREFKSDPFNRIIAANAFPRLRRLNLIVIDVEQIETPCDIALPTLCDLEELQLDGFASNQNAIYEIISQNAATLKVLEYHNVLWLVDERALPKNLTKLVMRNVETLNITDLVLNLLNLQETSSLRHFELTGKRMLNVYEYQHFLFERMCDTIAETVHTMTVDSWLLPYVTRRANQVLHTLHLYMTRREPLGDTLLQLEAMERLEHLHVNGNPLNTVALYDPPTKHDALLCQLTSLTIADFTFENWEFVEYAESISGLTVHRQNLDLNVPPNWCEFYIRICTFLMYFTDWDKDYPTVVNGNVFMFTTYNEPDYTKARWTRITRKCLEGHEFGLIDIISMLNHYKSALSEYVPFSILNV